MSTLKARRRQPKIKSNKLARKLQRKLWRVYRGDCRKIMRRWRKRNRLMDVIICDPPYHLTSITKRFGNAKLSDKNKTSKRSRDRSDGYGRLARGFMNTSWDGTMIAFEPRTWRRAFHVLKPGAYLIAFGGPRTSHRMTCAIEDAGFIIRDSVLWLHGQGFPKSHNISKAIDKKFNKSRKIVGMKNYGDNGRLYHGGEKSGRRSGIKGQIVSRIASVETLPASKLAKLYSGHGTALKPAFEPIIIAQKPIEGTIVGNVIKYGTGGINIDAGRIPYAGKREDILKDIAQQAKIASFNKSYGDGETGQSLSGSKNGSLHKKDKSQKFLDRINAMAPVDEKNLRRQLKRGQRTNNDGWGMNRPGSTAVPLLNISGRWPANVLHDGSPEVLQLFAYYGSKSSPRANGNPNNPRHGSKQRIKSSFDWQPERTSHDYRDIGTAARFFYTAKARKAERVFYCTLCNKAFKHTKIPHHQHGRETAKGKPDFSHITSHPTVKPLELMKYLVLLFTPPNGRVLDIFAGSGTTLQAAAELGFRCVGMEQDKQYIKHIKRRLRAAGF